MGFADLVAAGEGMVALTGAADRVVGVVGKVGKVGKVGVPIRLSETELCVDCTTRLIVCFGSVVGRVLLADGSVDGFAMDRLLADGGASRTFGLVRLPDGGTVSVRFAPGIRGLSGVLDASGRVASGRALEAS